MDVQMFAQAAIDFDGEERDLAFVILLVAKKTVAA
jgi:hypothetical protein